MKFYLETFVVSHTNETTSANFELECDSAHVAVQLFGAFRCGALLNGGIASVELEKLSKSKTRGVEYGRM